MTVWMLDSSLDPAKRITNVGRHWITRSNPRPAGAHSRPARLPCGSSDAFEWDAAKAAGNRRKHGVSFDLAAAVFRDPLMISISDEEHSETEERWITLGQAENSKLLLVVHTYLEISTNAANVRIISARPATKHEQRQYEAEL